MIYILDGNTITAAAKYKGQIVAQGFATNNMWKDQWSALLFLVKKLDSRGYRIKAGDFVITGAMNPLAFIERGHYKVDYGELGMIKFRVKDRKKAQN